MARALVFCDWTMLANAENLRAFDCRASFLHPTIISTPNFLTPVSPGAKFQAEQSSIRPIHQLDYREVT